MIPLGTHVIFAPPEAPGLHGVVRGLAPRARIEAWPDATIYLVEMGGAFHYVVGEMLVVIDRPAAMYAIDAGCA